MFLMLLLLLASSVFVVQVLPVLVDLAVEVVHDSLVELFGLHDVVLVALQCLPPGCVFGRIVVLNHSEVLLWHDITAVVEWFDLVGCGRHVTGQSVLAQVDMALELGPEQAVGCHSSTTRETATGGLVEVALSAAAADHSLAFRDEVVLEIGAHLPSQTLPVLVEHLATDEGEVVQLVPVVIFTLGVTPVLVIDLFLAVKEEELVLQHLVRALLCISFVLVALSHPPNIVVILLKLQISLLLLLDQMLAHFPQVVLQELLVCHLIDGDAFAKPDKFSWLVTHLVLTGDIHWAIHR